MATKSVGALIDQARELREAQRACQKQLDAAKAAYNEVAEQVIAALRAQDIEQSRGQTATATISETEVPQITNWESYYRFIKRNNAFFLLERRPAVAAWRELVESRKGRAIPGATPFKKVSLSLRNR